MNTDVDRAAYDAFMLAIRVVSLAFDLDKPASEFEKPFEMLRDVANGSLTLSSPAELGARFPALKDLVFDTASGLNQRDRETAGRVLRGLSSSI